MRVFDPAEIARALRQAKALAAKHRVPVVVEVILERVTNIAMGSEIDAINEFEPLAQQGTDAPTAVALMD
jgi:tartronate-semialdehyde synthase